ncbi:hypothetical protein D0T85_12640 [Bacteroides sp. 519]|nr:hypothetical protein [Bacteroides sp. 519]
MNKKVLKKNLVTLLWLLFIDIVLIGAWTLYFQPTSDMTIILIYAIPIVFIINLFLSIVFLFIKKYYVTFFLVNSFIAPVILYFLFGFYIHISLIRSYDSWEFYIDDAVYTIDTTPHSNNDYSLMISPEPGLSIGEDRGTTVIRNDTIYFTSIDGSGYFIFKKYLYGYKDMDKIKVKKIY